MSCRNRKDNGNPTLVAQIARHFNLPAPTASSSRAQDDLFQQFIYLTQVQDRPHTFSRLYTKIVLKGFQEYGLLALSVVLE